jgi:hypothetical protein
MEQMREERYDESKAIVGSSSFRRLDRCWRRSQVGRLYLQLVSVQSASPKTSTSFTNGDPEDDSLHSALRLDFLLPQRL